MNMYGKIVYSLRNESGMSREEVAEKAEISVRTLKNIECSAEISVTSFTANNIALALGCSLFDIIEEQGASRFSFYDRVNALSDQELDEIDYYISHGEILERKVVN